VTGINVGVFGPVPPPPSLPPPPHVAATTTLRARNARRRHRPSRFAADDIRWCLGGGRQQSAGASDWRTIAPGKSSIGVTRSSRTCRRRRWRDVLRHARGGPFTVLHEQVHQRGHRENDDPTAAVDSCLLGRRRLWLRLSSSFHCCSFRREAIN